MEQAEKLLRQWRHQLPKDGAKQKDVLAVIEHLGMSWRTGASSHVIASHPALIGNTYFPQGAVTVNCHYEGRQGVVHPKAIKDILRAAEIIEGEANE